MKSEKVTCSVCGQKSKFPVLKKDYCIEVALCKILSGSGHVGRQGGAWCDSALP